MSRNSIETKAEFRSACDAGGSCVEVGVVIGVRDSKNPQGPVLWYTQDEWHNFIEGAKAGAFDVSFGPPMTELI